MTMFCPDEERLSAWVDRGLTPVEDESISTHLAACEECRRAVTIAFLVDRESPESITDDGQHRLFQTVQGALVRPSGCVSEEELAAWLHDGLASTERAEVTDHLAECDDCRRIAALARLSNSEPVSALGAAQETRALNLVLRSAGRDVFFSFWRVAAASVLVAIAATYIAIQWSGPATVSRTVATVPALDGTGSSVGHLNDNSRGTGPAAVVTPPLAPATQKQPVAEPVKAPEPAPPIPARFLHVPVFESEGLSACPRGRLSYGDVLRPKGTTAWINVEGRALVVLDESPEAKVAYAADAGAYVLELTRGRAFIDTAGDEQTWEIRRGDRTVTLRAFRGRATAKAEEPGMRVDILRGSAELGPDRLEEGRGVDVQKDSSVALDPKDQAEKRRKACDALTAHYLKIRPDNLLVLRAAGGKDCTDGPWQYHSPSRTAELLEEGAMIPECSDPIRWVRIELDEPLRFTSDMVLRAACGGTGSKVYLWVGGKGAWYREADRKFIGTGPEEWSLKELHKDMVNILAGEELRKIMIGIVQERGRESTLEVDGIEIRRVLD